jgi:6-phosphogluconolactonase
MSAELRVAPTPERAAADCAAETVALVQRALESKPRVAMAVSGGSTPKVMFGFLAAAPLDWSRIHLFWVDERGVPPDHPQSNFRMTKEHLLGVAKIPPSSIHRIQAELEPQEAAARYAEEIRAFFELQPGATPRFDLIHLGMGPDSHTASLFPGEALVRDRTGLVAATYVPKMEQWRITLLPGVLLSADKVFVLAAGPDKAAPLRDVLEGPLDPLQHPAQLAMRERDAICFLDAAAAGQGAAGNRPA